MPKAPLHTLFDDSQTSPYGAPPWASKKGAQQFVDSCAKVYKSSTTRELGSQLGRDGSREGVAEALATLGSACRCASLDTILAKAQETLEAKRQRRTLAWGSTAAVASGAVAPS